MHKRDLFQIVIVVGFVLFLLTSLAISITIYSFEFSVNWNNAGAILEVIRIYLQYLFTIPFFVIILMYYKKDKNLTYFSLFVLISRLFQITNVSLIVLEQESSLNPFLVSISGIMGILALLLAFRMIILDELDKKITKIILFIGIIYLIFESGIAGTFIYVLSSFFGHSLFMIVYTLFLTGIMVSEVFGIKILYNYDKELKEKPKTEIVYAMDALKKMQEEKRKNT